MPRPEPNPHLDGIVRIQERPWERPGLLRLDRNERLAPFPPGVYRAMLDGLDPEVIMRYPDTSPLYERMSRTLEIPVDWLLLTSGSDGGVRAACHAYVRPGDGVVMLDPGYAMYPIYTRMFGGRVRLVPYDKGLVIDVDALVDAIQPGVRLAIVAEPNQPTGTLLPDGGLGAVLERAERVGAVVVVDEAYFPFSGRTVLPLVASRPNLIVLRTFSKAAGLAGLRVGYAVGQPTVLRPMMKVRGAHDVNGVAVQFACYVLDHPSIVDDYVIEVQRGKTVLEGAARLGLEVLPTFTNFQLLRVSPRRDPAALVKALREEGVLVRGPFDVPCLRDCIRVTLGPPDVMCRFLEALTRVLVNDAVPAFGEN